MSEPIPLHKPFVIGCVNDGVLPLRKGDKANILVKRLFNSVSKNTFRHSTLLQVLCGMAALFYFTTACHASVTLQINVSSLSGATTRGAYVRGDIANCTNPTIVNTGTSIPLTQNYPLVNGTATITLPDNVTQIVCNGVQFSYYVFTLVVNGVETPIKNVMLPPGNFNIANLANVITPPFNPGVVSGPQGPAGPQGPSGPAGSSSTGTPVSEIPAGAINGSNTTFTLSLAPVSGSLLFQYNGQPLTLNVGYTLSGNTVTLAIAPVSTDNVYASYIVSSSTPINPYGEIPSGAIDGANTVFTLSYTPISGSLLLQLNGLFLQPSVGYSISGNTATLLVTPQIGDVLYANYYK